MIVRIVLPLLTFFCLLSVSGCWDRNEPEDLGVVSAVAVEKGDQGKIRLTIQTLNTTALAKGSSGRGVEFEKAYRNTVAEADTIFEALSKMSRTTATKRFLSHTNVFLVSEDLARERGVMEIIDFLERDPQIRLDAWLVIARGSVVELLDVPGRISSSPSIRIADIIKHRELSFSYAPLKLAEFIRMLQSDSTHPFTAVVESQPNLSFIMEQGHGILYGSVPEPLNNVTLNGTAVFKQDKMVGWLDDRESRGLLWLRGEVKQGTMEFPVAGTEGKKVVTAIVGAKTELQPEIKDGHYRITVKIEVESYLEDNQAGIGVEKMAELKKVENAQGLQVERDVRAALKKAQTEYQVDVFGFGEAMHRKYPDEWKLIKTEWSQIFPRVEVEIEVKSNIRHTSLISKPAKPGEK